MLVRILKRLDRDELDELDLRRFKVGDSYDVTPQLGMLLVVGGYAEIVPAFGRAEAADRPRRKKRPK